MEENNTLQACKGTQDKKLHIFFYTFITAVLPEAENRGLIKVEL